MKRTLNASNSRSSQWNIKFKTCTNFKVKTLKQKFPRHVLCLPISGPVLGSHEKKLCARTRRVDIDVTSLKFRRPGNPRGERREGFCTNPRSF